MKASGPVERLRPKVRRREHDARRWRDRARRGGFPMKIVKMAIECDDGAVLEWSTDNVWLRR